MVVLDNASTRLLSYRASLAADTGAVAFIHLVLCRLSLDWNSSLASFPWLASAAGNDFLEAAYNLLARTLASIAQA